MGRRATIGLLLIATLGAWIGGLFGWLLHTGSRPFEGTTFGGYRPDDSMLFGDWLELERRHFSAQPIGITGDGFSIELSASRLGIEVDIAAMQELVHRQTTNGSLLKRLGAGIAARRHLSDFAWLTRFDRDTARAALVELAKSVEKTPIDAELDLVHRRQVRASPGTRLDVERTLDFIESHRSVELQWVPLAMRELPPRIRDEDLIGIEVNRVLSHFETDFRTRAGTRAVNIHVAARALHGQVLGPGATFSFNGIVGPRIEARGYREAPVIVDDELEPGVGGGVCQVATTLHAAAVLGGLEILERRSHSRPSGYAPLGLDATVIDGQVDLKLRNPYTVPVGIMTSFPDRFRLRIELVGLFRPAHIEHAFAIGKRYEFYRRVVTRAELLPGGFKKKQKGNWGYDVTSTVTARFGNGTTSRKHYRSRYWPVPEVFWVGPDTVLSVLPPLPEGATGVQLDGTTVMGTIPPAVEERAGKAEPDADSIEQ